jgi:ATP-dependent helicase HrpA
MSGVEQLKVRYPEELPIVAHRGAIIDMLKSHQVVVIAGETGSGKTTQIPKMCLEAGLALNGKIACTQPRRVAALSISRRIAEELGVVWGCEVGAKIRFTDKTRPETVVKVMTDGMLLTEIQGDPEMREYSVVIIDEAHERSLNIDFLLGYLKQLLQRRRDLKVVITSATIDTQAFSEAFGNAPVIEVSGRLYPVETRYSPIDELLEDSGEMTYVDAVVRAIEDILELNRPGDLLVFLPGEKDIREVRDVLEKRGHTRLEILPLFGRLSGPEQDRIFKGSRHRKVILSTNIAETSITIPGIRFVVDSGLARISRYSAGTHTRRLPIEKIPQSSANQRKGRAGRLSEGVCVRLYSEQDYQGRPQYGVPEILRCNLADVILKMIAFRIGDIRSFPFINPPGERAIRAGFELLVQLGALDSGQRLTPLGRKLAHLPVDPTVGRMLLEANREGCVREVLVIAAGLSIQDPRERPMDAAKEADEMHRRFQHPDSDFLTLLNIWNAYHDEMERLSQNQLRKFCKAHFLSYLRMREWRDIHTQLERTLKEIRMFRGNTEPAEYEQVHRALLSGLLSGVGQLEETNHYRATRNRKVMVFPGSGLFIKTERKKGGKSKGPEPAAPRSMGAKWILCAEFMETTRLYARTVARIDPQWILRIGEHVLAHKYTEPMYDEKGERVMARERILLYGLEVATRRTAYLKVNPKAATEIFIREALVEGRLQTRLPFEEANRKLLEEIRERQTRLRLGSTWALDERLYDFYAERIRDVGSLGDLKAFLRDNHGGKTEFLFAGEADLLPPDRDDNDLSQFPDTTEMEGIRLNLAYAYKPGEEDDGATLKIPVEQFDSIQPETIDWAVPGYIRQRIEHLLRGLPKEMRKQLFPLADVTQEMALAVSPGKGPLLEQLTELLWEKKGLRVGRGDWSRDAVPEHLVPRVELVDREQRTIAAGRDWEKVARQYEQAVRAGFEKGEGRDKLKVWKDGCRRYEMSEVHPDSLPVLPLEIHLGDIAGLPVKAWPGLEAGKGGVRLKLFPTPEAARMATRAGFPALCEEALGKDLGWLQRDLAKELKRVALGYVFILDSQALVAESFGLLRNHLLSVRDCLPLDPARLRTVVESARREMKGLVPRYVDLLEAILQRRQRVLDTAGGQEAWNAELDALLHKRFLRQLSLSRLFHYPRYLEAMELRIRRARQNPVKDAEKAQPLLAYIRRFQALKAPAGEKRRLRWLLEEFKVQTFAQELGTDGKVSPKVLDAAFAEAEASGRPQGIQGD